MHFPPTLRFDAVKTERSMVFLLHHSIRTLILNLCLKIYNLHLILAYRARTTLSVIKIFFFQTCFSSVIDKFSGSFLFVVFKPVIFQASYSLDLFSSRYHAADAGMFVWNVAPHTDGSLSDLSHITL